MHRIYPLILLGMLAIFASCAASAQPMFANRNGGCPAGVANNAAFQKWLGVKTTFAYDGNWWDSWDDIVTSAQRVPACWHAAGYRQITYALSPIPNTPSVTLKSGLTGAYDAYYQATAKGLINAGFANAIIRIGWEFNGNWYPWAAQKDPASFIALWQRIVTIMRAVPGQRFQFDWCFSLLIAPDAYYPGDAYVDYIGADVYDRWFNAPATEVVRWHQTVYGAYGLQWQINFAKAHNKQVSYPEWGLGRGMTGDQGDDGAWMLDMGTWIKSHVVAYHNVWDEGADEFDNGQNPLSAASYYAKFGPYIPKPKS